MSCPDSVKGINKLEFDVRSSEDTLVSLDLDNEKKWQEMSPKSRTSSVKSTAHTDPPHQ